MTTADVAQLERASLENAQWCIQEFVNKMREREVPADFVLRCGWFKKVAAWQLPGVESFGQPIYVLEDERIALVERRVYQYYGIFWDGRGKKVEDDLAIRKISELFRDQRAIIANALLLGLGI